MNDDDWLALPLSSLTSVWVLSLWDGVGLKALVNPL